jgi:hypothetical protein
LFFTPLISIKLSEVMNKTTAGGKNGLMGRGFENALESMKQD